MHAKGVPWPTYTHKNVAFTDVAARELLGQGERQSERRDDEKSLGQHRDR
jgi:hypothetical protein